MPAEKAHFARIDALRGAAIFAVFIYHYTLAVHQRHSGLAHEAQVSSSWGPLLDLPGLGFLGVQLFFVISGFCIHYSYITWRERNPNLPLHRFFPGFFQRRFWRIVPPYLVALLTVYFAKTAHPFSAGSVMDLLPHVALWNTLFENQFFAINPSFWSVAVEWQLYLAYPLILLLFLRFGGLGGFFAATLVSVAFRFVMPLVHAPFFIQNLPFKWWYDWSIGALIASSWSEQRRIFPQGWICAFVFTVVAYVSVVQTEFVSVRWAMPPLYFAYVVESAVFSKRSLSWFTRAFALLGICSYSFYLWHQPLTAVVVTAFARRSWNVGPFTIWVGLSSLLLVAITLWSLVAYRWIELPSIAFGKRLQGRYHQRRISADSQMKILARPVS